MQHAPALALMAASALAWTAPAAAQETDAPPPAEANDLASAFDGDFLTLGAGAAFVPSYDGSDNYVITPVPMIQGRFAGIDINPRPAGLALDFIPDKGTGAHFSFGPSVRLRANRTRQVSDDVVELLPELDTAIEVGPTVGVSFSGVLNPYDSLGFSVDARWDVMGAHNGMVVEPSISYSTPLSEGIGAILSVGGGWADDDFMDYYHSVDAEGAALSGLPEFKAKGGLRSVGTQLLLGFDLNGDLRDGGAALFVVGGYSRLLGDAADTPITSMRGSADQWLGGAGIAYTF